VCVVLLSVFCDLKAADCSIQTVNARSASAGTLKSDSSRRRFASTPRARAYASGSLSNDVAQNVLVERQIGHRALEPGITILARNQVLLVPSYFKAGCS
jgi:hypothetical protein